MKDFLLEIGTEEMPYWAVKTGIEQLENNFANILKENAIKYEGLKVYGGPRRLTVRACLSEEQESREEKTRGPAYKTAFDENGKPTKAARGFARARGVKVDELVGEDTENGKYVFAVKEIKGIKTNKFLTSKLSGLVKSLTFNKSMKWGTGKLKFVRPIRWITCLFGEEVIKFKIENITSGRVSYGHRFLSEGKIELKKSSDYEEVLEERGHVIVDHQKRREVITKGAKQQSAKVSGRPVLHRNVLEEIVHLVEYPHPLLGGFEDFFLELPDEVLTTVMEVHQRYIPVKAGDGSLLPNFVLVHNGDPRYQNTIRKGNERVIRARLADAQFFFNEDLKTSLIERVPELKGVIFQKKLGSLFDKTKRVEKLTAFCCELLNCIESKEYAVRAATLSKVDLLTDMVNEFPELEGIMGREYSLRQGEQKEVANAIFEHYLPRFSGDRLPESKAGAALSIADKIDTVAGYFLCGIEPTGSEDPYSLRRQSQGAVLTVFDRNIDFDISAVLKKAVEGYKNVKNLKDRKQTIKSLEEFFIGRIEKILTDMDYPQEFVSALSTYAMRKPYTAKKKLDALVNLKEDSKLDDILIPYRRVRNLSRIKLGNEIDESLLEEKTEIELYRKLKKTAEKYSRAESKEALNLLIKLRKPIDDFFDEVLVMTEDKKIRENRLCLLNFIRGMYEEYANFSRLL